VWEGVESMDVGGRGRHMLAFFLLWRFVKEKPQILQVYMAVQTLVKHR